MPDRVGGAIGVGDRPVEQADRVEAFEVRGIGQHQIGVGHHFAGVGVAVDDPRNFVFAAGVLVGEPVDGLAGVHRRVPAHVRHEHQQRVDSVRIAGMRIADHRMQQAVRGQRVRPRERMVDAARLAVLVHDQIFRPVDEAQRCGIQRAVLAAQFARTVRRRHRLRERRLIAEAARRIHRTQQHLQHVQRAAGVEAVAVRADPAHRVHRHRASDHLAVFAAPAVGPRDGQTEVAVERGFREFARDAADGVGGDAAAVADRIGRILRVEIAFGQQLEDGDGDAAVGQGVFADDGGVDVGGVGGCKTPLPPEEGLGRGFGGL